VQNDSHYAEPAEQVNTLHTLFGDKIIGQP
jgi:hypothetical protein